MYVCQYEYVYLYTHSELEHWCNIWTMYLFPSIIFIF